MGVGVSVCVCYQKSSELGISLTLRVPACGLYCSNHLFCVCVSVMVVILKTASFSHLKDECKLNKL